MGIKPVSSRLGANTSTPDARLFQRLHIDLTLLVALLALCGFGLVVLYSAGEQNAGIIERQLARLGLAFGIMVAIAQISPQTLRRWSPGLYVIGVLMLLAVLVVGEIGKGAQRWLDLGVFRFQPSEVLKLAVPMTLAWLLSSRPLPPRPTSVLLALTLTLVPVVLIAKQPDLGTSLLVASAGILVLFMAGLSWRMILGFALLAAAIAPLVWFGMHDYQRARVLTFLDPQSDPLGTGYHIIQSQIAIGSGGISGKGWLNGTQSHLEFLPERHTDFIFAVIGEEFGFSGILALLALYLFIVLRGLFIAVQAQDNFGRLLAGGLTLVFFVYVFVNTGMVSGLLPVVGVPLPLISYGGTSMVTLLAGFGILMSIETHKQTKSR
ncbi:rod shape-determining protein RodA [Thiorhodococcus fuscus]|uniref:Peptidoglycan glycosyltransferase MrdB n=1 Tax=Thiorhodococcus fuscus TaxID=527200 RepID=A0ABW4YBA1_9GAMM